MTQKFIYPETKKVDQVDDYHGVKVADPYRWLEDPDAEDSRTWIEAQNNLTAQFLDQIPDREKIKERLTQLWNYEKYSAPFKEGGRYFFYRNDGLQNQSVLYTADLLDEAPRVLLDPNELSSDGTIALSNLAISNDGRLMAYSLSTAGSDWQEWKVLDVISGEDFSDLLKWSKFSGAAWTPDNKGFYYSRYDEPSEKTKLEDANYFQKLYYHRLGSAQAEDVLIYERKDQKEWGFSGAVTDDGNYLIISVWKGTDPKNLLFYRDISKPNQPVIELIDNFEAAYSFIGNDGPIFYFRTDLNAPRGRVIAIDINHPQRENWKELISQASETIDTENDVQLIHRQFVVSYLKDAHTQIKIFDLRGNFIREVELPGLGTVADLRGKPQDTEFFYLFTGFTTPATVYRYDLETGMNTVFRKPRVAFNPDDYETRQIFYPSKDGTKVPMFITHKKGLPLDGNNPTYLYGYGGFGVSLTPMFSIANLVWMEMGGVYAQPSLRGGGEYGEEWHQAGMKLKKQNVFDDFIAAAEWLIGNNYTVKEKLAIGGGSNGGLLVGACLTQRPDLFGAATPAVGVLDMLRFQKFTIGWAWVSDYGSSENPEEFTALYAYSPLHNINSGTAYPATLVITADHDDRVVPAHSFKFTAALQAAQAGAAPILIRIDTDAGHGAGKPTAKIIEEISDKWGFLATILLGKIKW